jgi:fluoride exporter
MRLALADLLLVARDCGTGWRMTRVLLVGLAGALGTLARYGVAVWAGRAIGTTFPYGTLLVNLAGCFLIAFVSQLALSTTMISPTVKLTLTTGFMGGLTTYSAFDFETTILLKERAWGAAGLYVGVTLLGCFAAGLLGMAVAKRFAEA